MAPGTRGENKRRGAMETKGEDGRQGHSEGEGMPTRTEGCPSGMGGEGVRAIAGTRQPKRGKNRQLLGLHS